MIKASWLASVVVVGGLVVFASTQGCGDDADTSKNGGVSRKGEACQKTSDCAAGLACLPNNAGVGGVCTVGAFSVTQTAKECAIIACKVAQDCCPTPPSDCAQLKQECDQETDAGFGASGICTTYKSECVCDASTVACVSGQCKSNCKIDADCTTSGTGSKCLGGACGQCAIDTDCAALDPTYTCVNAKCQPPCQTDGDCSGFDRCVAGKCQDGGCLTDRECVYATKNVESTCGTDGKCVTPCQTDLECGNPKDYKFFSCISGKCQYVGCNEDKDCQFYFSDGFTSSSSSSGSVALTSKAHIVCQPKATTTTSTIPAQR